MYINIHIHACTVKIAERENHSEIVKAVLKLFYLNPKSRTYMLISACGIH